MTAAISGFTGRQPAVMCTTGGGCQYRISSINSDS